MVITGLTRNQFVRKHTRVRIPLSPPKRRTTQSGGSFFFQTAEREGFERSEQNNTGCCFGTVTEDFCETSHKINSETLSKNQERIPLFTILNKYCIFLLFCSIIISPINKNLTEVMYA